MCTSSPDRLPGAVSCEIAVVGGGLAGSALAAHLAQAGRRVALLERERFPRDKLCGEFLSPESRSLLEELGCLRDVIERGAATIGRARFTSSRGRVIEFPLPGEGLGISRRALDEILFRRAAASGAETLEGTVVRSARERSADGQCWVELELERLPHGAHLASELMTTRALIGAWGRNGGFAAARAPHAPRSREHYVGIKRHHHPAPSTAGDRLRSELRGTVEIHAFEGGYCGLSFVENDVVNVCMLLRKRTIKSLDSTRWSHVREFLAHANPLLKERLDALVRTERKMLAVGWAPPRTFRPTGEPELRVGDAAGMIAPLCGDGQAMALASARLLASLVCRLPRDVSAEQQMRLRRDWRRTWRRHYAARLRLARWLQSIVLEPRLAHAAFGVLQLFPSLAASLVRWTRE